MASLIRMQIQLDRQTRDALRRRAFAEGTSIAAVARRLLREALSTPRPGGLPPARTARDLFPFIGIIEGDAAPVAERHDEFLFEDEQNSSSWTPSPSN